MPNTPTLNFSRSNTHLAPPNGSGQVTPTASLSPVAMVMHAADEVGQHLNRRDRRSLRAALSAGISQAWQNLNGEKIALSAETEIERSRQTADLIQRRDATAYTATVAAGHQVAMEVAVTHTLTLGHFHQQAEQYDRAMLAAVRRSLAEEVANGQITEDEARATTLRWQAEQQANADEWARQRARSREATGEMLSRLVANSLPQSE
jgi:hypothetical protein